MTDAFGDIQTKRVSESRVYDFDLSKIDPAVTSLTAPAVTQENQGKVSGSSALTIDPPAMSGGVIQARISGGTDGELYKLIATATDQNSNDLELTGWLEVEDVPSSAGLTVEDGTGLAAADSYLSLADADAYWNARRNAAWLNSDQFRKEAVLREATQYLDGRFEWIGSHPGGGQALGWPRTGAFDHEGRALSGVPQKVRDATAELALEALGDRLLPAEARGGRTRREKVGALEVEYQDGAGGGRSYGFVALLLKGLITGSGNAPKLVRA